MENNCENIIKNINENESSKNNIIMNTRNVTVIAHIDAGKTSLTDTFVARAGLINADEAGDKKWTDTRDDEQTRNITIKSTGVSMNFNFENDDYHVNLIDSPGHIDFSSEVSSALRITDGAIVVIDAVEGVAAQTENVLRQALMEQVKTILFINKMDRYIFELMLTPEEAYNKIVTIIMQVNELISVYKSPDSQLNLDLSPELGNVIFGSALYQWGFNLHTFATLITKKTGGDVASMMKNLWGDFFYDPEKKKITTQSIKNGKKLERTFCKYILTPIFTMVKSIMKKETTVYIPMFEAVGISFNEKDLTKTEKDFYKFAMKKFLPLVDSILYGVVHHLPSPKQAQLYRYSTLYNGPLDDECALAIKNCDANGPLMIYISKMIPMDNGGRFYAFGRVFSGTVSTGQKVRIMGPNYKQGSKEDLFENKPIQRVVKMIGSKIESCETIECGNTVALIGIDQYILKSCTITTHLTTCPIKTMKFTVSPVVRQAVSPKNSSDLPKLVEGLKKLSKSDPCVQVIMTPDGENIIACVGELHLEICINDLKKFTNCDIITGLPIVPLRETVLNLSSQVCLSKSPNKHNRLYMTAEPLAKELVEQMERKEITALDDINVRSKTLVTSYNWDVNDSKKIWYFGPTGDEETNVVVDTTKGVQYLNEIKDSVNAGFQWATNNGPLCDEPIRGVRYNILDCMLHADTIHRGGSQLIPTARRALNAAMLTAQPAIMEPIYQVEIQVSDAHIGTIYSCLSHKKGQVISEEKSIGSLNIIKGYLPVRQSFGFDKYIKQATSGQAFPQLNFSHWSVMNGNPFDENSEVGKLVRETRKRKGMSENIPDLSNYLDKL